MTDLERSALIQILAGTPARLKGALKGVPKKLLLWSPGPGKWSILEIVAHMRDMERDAYIARYHRILAEDNPTLPDIDGDLLALTGDYRNLKLADVLRDWMKLRKECLRLLKSVKGARWERVGTHEFAGPLTIDGLLRRQAMGNDEAHLEQIEGILKRAAAFEALEPAPRRLADMTKKLDDALLRRKPAPDKWSALEVVCHLRDVEQRWAERLVRIAFSDRPSFLPFDVNALAATRRYNEQDPGAALKDFARLREDNLRLLRVLPASQWNRAGVHAKYGELTVHRIVDMIINHDRGHFEQITRAVS